MSGVLMNDFDLRDVMELSTVVQTHPNLGTQVLSFPWPLRLLFASRPDALSYVYVLELGRNKFEGPASDFDDLEKAFWVARVSTRATAATGASACRQVLTASRANGRLTAPGAMPARRALKMPAASQ